MKYLKAWAIISALPDKEEKGYPFLDKNYCYLIFFDKKSAEKINSHMDEAIVPVEIKIKI